MEQQCDKLLKEWAIVCRFLEKGRQIFIARKGGIAEKEGRFVVENREFFLLPTYLHQSPESLKPEYHLDFELVQGEEPKDGKVHLPLFAKAIETIEVKNESMLEFIDDDHAGSKKLLQERYRWGNEKGLTLVLLRVYKIPEELVLPMKSAYRGCKSWITLEKPQPLPAGLTPALSDWDFYRKREALLKKLLS